MGSNQFAHESVLRILEHYQRKFCEEQFDCLSELRLMFCVGKIYVSKEICVEFETLMASLVPIWDSMCPMYDGDSWNSKSSYRRICGHTFGCLVDKSQLYWKDLAYEVTRNDNPTISNRSATQFIEAVVSPYKTFEETSRDINRKLRTEFQKDTTFSIKDNVTKVYTCASINMCKSLPGMMRMHTTLQSDATGYMPSFDVVVDPVFSNYSSFKQLDYSDQQMIVRLGQSASRILVASVNWYKADTRSFEDFLAWRNDEDLFKRLLLDCAAKISELRLEESDVAILNYLLLVGTDYPCLMNPGKLEKLGSAALDVFKIYWKGKHGNSRAEKERIEKIFCLMSEVKKLGYYIHAIMMMSTKSMKLEDCRKWLNDVCNCDASRTIDDSVEVILRSNYMMSRL